MKWSDGKPYYSLNQYYKDIYGEKIYKIALDIGTTCPNRDGNLDTRGCIFCSSQGSGDFASVLNTSFDTGMRNPDDDDSSSDSTFRNQIADSVNKQIDTAILKLRSKYSGRQFIAYLQSYTNTYGNYNYLKLVYETILNHPSIVGMNIGTRPDCLNDDILTLLESLNTVKPITVELGLQTIHETTANYIRRCYPLNIFDKAIVDLNRISIPVVVHMIAGLPGEDKKNFLDSISYISCKPIQGIKLQMLHILADSDLGQIYNRKPFNLLTLDAYAELIVDAIAIIPQDIVIHRITGDGNKATLIEPKWTLNKRHVLNTIHKTFAVKNKWQGSDIQTLPKEGDNQ